MEYCIRRLQQIADLLDDTYEKAKKKYFDELSAEPISVQKEDWVYNIGLSGKNEFLRLLKKYLDTLIESIRGEFGGNLELLEAFR